MGMGFAMQILFEICLVLLLAYGFYHEDDLIELETVLKQYAKKKLRKGAKKWNRI